MDIAQRSPRHALTFALTFALGAGCARSAAVQTASSQARGTSAPAETVGKHVRELLGTSGVLG